MKQEKKKTKQQFEFEAQPTRSKLNYKDPDKSILEAEERCRLITQDIVVIEHQAASNICHCSHTTFSKRIQTAADMENIRENPMRSNNKIHERTSHQKHRFLLLDSIHRCKFKAKFQKTQIPRELIKRKLMNTTMHQHNRTRILPRTHTCTRCTYTHTHGSTYTQ